MLLWPREHEDPEYPMLHRRVQPRLACGPGEAQPNPATAYLRKQGTATQMIVDGKPFLMLAGELRNSTTSSLEFMKRGLVQA